MTEEQKAVAEILAEAKKDPESILEGIVLGLVVKFFIDGDSRVAKHEIGDEVRARLILHEKGDPAWRHIEWHGPKALWDMAVAACDKELTAKS